MSRQRVTGMRIPHTPCPPRTGWAKWFNILMVVVPLIAIVFFWVAGEPVAVVVFIVTGAFYQAAEVHS